MRVTSNGTIHVQRNTYTVPPRLTRESVVVRLYDLRLEVFYAGRCQLAAERLRGEGKHRVDYRHVIWSLVRKPWGFARYRYRESLFPTLAFRRAYAALGAALPEHRADLEYLRVLHLAAETLERFRGLGVDLTEDHALAHELAEHPGNKPLFGFVKRHRLDEPRMQRELDLALAHHADKGNEKGVALCLWAGADAHAPVPVLEFLGDEDDEEENDWYSAIDQACRGGHGGVLEKLGPDPARDDFDQLYRAAGSAQVVEVLARKGSPADGSRAIRVHLEALGWWWRDREPVETLRALFATGVRWEWSPVEEVAGVRRALLGVGDWTFTDVMELLAADGHCSPDVLAELARTEAIRKRMRKARLLPPRPKERQPFDAERPTPKQRQVAASFGIELPKPKVPKVEKLGLPSEVSIGSWHPRGRQLRLDREALFDRVWSVPVERLAREWGLSGRGLAKACRRLRVPVPSRGYWARVAAGQRVRRPQLPKLPPGQAEKVVVRVPEAVDGEQDRGEDR